MVITKISANSCTAETALCAYSFSSYNRHRCAISAHILISSIVRTNVNAGQSRAALSQILTQLTCKLVLIVTSFDSARDDLVGHAILDAKFAHHQIIDSARVESRHVAFLRRSALWLREESRPSKFSSRWRVQVRANETERRTVVHKNFLCDSNKFVDSCLSFAYLVFVN